MHRTTRWLKHVDLPQSTTDQIKRYNQVRGSGWTAHSQYRRPLTAVVNSFVVDLFRASAQLDARLYAVGVELFEQQLARMPPTFDQELAEFRAQLAAYHRGGADCVDCLGTSAPA